MDIIERQTVVISINCNTMNPTGISSQVTLPMNLRFAADELVVKNIAYSANSATNDVSNTVQIACLQTNDNLIGCFPNSNTFAVSHNDHFKLNNKFQVGNLSLQLQGTDGSVASFNPQGLISQQSPQRTFGVVVLTIEFIKYDKEIKQKNTENNEGIISKYKFI